ncbi:MAG: glycosyltransferase family 39 protein [Deltaproteobacteria bacterium]|nr:glycosyltransferase family 39 protein [Deltaproteobacteria bacterium]
MDRMLIEGDSAFQRASGSSSWVQSVSSLVWFLPLVLFILFNNLGGAALFDPDEGRNAEIAREVLLLGDWVTPHYNFIPRLDKPIAHYWTIALSYKIFGVSEWSARLPSAVAALGCLILTYCFARRFLGADVARWGVLILVTSVEFFLLSRTVILDMAFAFFITLALSAFYRAVQIESAGAKKLHYVIMFAAAGMSTLIKGPIGFILPGSVVFGYLVLTRKWFLLREVEWFWGGCLFVAIVGPWYALVEQRNPGYLRYIFIEEGILRFLTNRYNRSEPWYYFILVLALGFLPWTVIIPVAVKDFWNKIRSDLDFFLWVWTGAVLLFFSFSASKLPHYILPLYPALSMLVAKAVTGILGSPAKKWSLRLPWLTLAFPLLILLVGLYWPDWLPGHVKSGTREALSILPYPLIFIGVPLSLMILNSTLADRLAVRGYFFSLSCLGLLSFFALSHQAIEGVSYSRSSVDLAAGAAWFATGREQVVIYDAYPPGLPFYLRIHRPMWVVSSADKRSIMGSAYVAEKKPLPAKGFAKVLLTFEEFSLLLEKSGERLLIFTRQKLLPRLLNEKGLRPIAVSKIRGDGLVVHDKARGAQSRSVPAGANTAVTGAQGEFTR